MYYLSVGAWTNSTSTLGPGRRFAVWLQGCPFDCPGCVAPGFLPFQGGERIAVFDLVDMVASGPECEGVTISGGEPLHQAEALSIFLSHVRNRLEKTVILYTGFCLPQIQSIAKKRPAFSQILSATDVLIDGRYEHARNNSLGLRGSTNQTIHFLTPRYHHLRAHFESSRRRHEIQYVQGSEMLIGLPTLNEWREVSLDPTGRSWYRDAANEE